MTADGWKHEIRRDRRWGDGRGSEAEREWDGAVARGGRRGAETKRSGNGAEGKRSHAETEPCGNGAEARSAGTEPLEFTDFIGLHAYIAFIARDVGFKPGLYNGSILLSPAALFGRLSCEGPA